LFRPQFGQQSAHRRKERRRLRGKGIDFRADRRIFWHPSLWPSAFAKLRLAFNRYNSNLPVPDFKYPGLDVFPNIQIMDDLNVQIGPNPSGPQATIQNTYQIADNFTWIKGRHTVKVGYYQRIFHEHTFQDFCAAGCYNFSSGQVGSTGNPFADFLFVDGATSTENSTEDIKWYYPARETYVQDQIKISRKLTATVGLRWAPFFGYQEQLGRITAFRPGQQSTVFPNAPAGLVVAGDRGISKS